MAYGQPVQRAYWSVCLPLKPFELIVYVLIVLRCSICVGQRFGYPHKNQVKCMRNLPVLQRGANT